MLTGALIAIEFYSRFCMSKRYLISKEFILRILPALFVILLCAAGLACQRNVNVTYEATGDAETVDITVTNDMGSTEQYNDVPLPWRMDYDGFVASQPYIYAYNNGDVGSIKISIYINGKLAKTATCSGPYANTTVYVDR